MCCGRGDINPNPNFRKQLEEYEKKLMLSWEPNLPVKSYKREKCDGDHRTANMFPLKKNEYFYDLMALSMLLSQFHVELKKKKEQMGH